MTKRILIHEVQDPRIYPITDPLNPLESIRERFSRNEFDLTISNEGMRFYFKQKTPSGIIYNNAHGDRVKAECPLPKMNKIWGIETIKEIYDKCSLPILVFHHPRIDNPHMEDYFQMKYEGIIKDYFPVKKREQNFFEIEKFINSL